MEEEIKVKKNYAWPLLLIVIAIVLLGMVGFYYFKKTNDPKEVYMSLFEDFNEFYNEIIDKGMKNLNSPRKGNASFVINVTDKGKILNGYDKLLNKLDLNVNYEIDYKNKVFNSNYVVNYDKELLGNISLSANKDILYGKINNSNDKAHKMSIDEKIWNDEYIRSLNNIYNELYNSLVSSLDESYFTKEKVVLNVNGKDKKVNKLSLNINKDNSAKLLGNIKSYLGKSDTFIEAISFYSDMSKEEVIKEINNINVDEEFELKVDLYKKDYSDNIIKVDILSNEYNIGLILNDEDEYDIYNDNKKIGTVSILKDSIKYSIQYEDNDYKFSINGEIKDDYVLINCSGNVSNQKFTFSIKYDNDKLNISVDMPNVLIIEINGTLKEEVAKEIKPVTYNNAVLVESLDENEMQNILSEFTKNKGYEKLVGDITNMN